MPLPAEGAGRFTYSDYLTWPDGERWELIGGEAWNMTPAPSLRHQRVAGLIFHLLQAALGRHRCVPYIAPADVILSEEDVVQPDVFVVCDPMKIRPEGVHGSPDVVVEVLSPATALKDRRAKWGLYERSGVREYVLVDPEAQYAERWSLGDDGRYGRSDVLGPQEVLRLGALEGLEVPLAEVFELPEEEPGGVT